MNLMNIIDDSTVQFILNKVNNRSIISGRDIKTFYEAFNHNETLIGNYPEIKGLSIDIENPLFNLDDSYHLEWYSIQKGLFMGSQMLRIKEFCNNTCVDFDSLITEGL